MLFAAFIESSPVPGDPCFRIALPADVVKDLCDSIGQQVHCKLNGDVSFSTSPTVTGDEEGFVNVPASLCLAYGLHKGSFVYVELDCLFGKQARRSKPITEATH